MPLIGPTPASGSEIGATTTPNGGAPTPDRLGQRANEQHDHNDRGDDGEAIEEHPEGIGLVTQRICQGRTLAAQSTYTDVYTTIHMMSTKCQ